MKKSYLTESLALFVFALATFIILFTWHKRRTDRAGCIINIRNAQQAVRGYQGMTGGQGTSEQMWHDIFNSADPYMALPICPSGGTYTFHKPSPSFQPPGFLFCTCSHAKTLNHKPDNTADW